MSSTSEPITVLNENESWNLLSSVALGRYVTSLGSGRLEIFPVNFVVQKRTVLFRTAEGTKLFGAMTHNQVLFEADNNNVDGGWSVIVRGTARVLYGSTELDEAERAGLHPWIATENCVLCASGQPRSAAVGSYSASNPTAAGSTDRR